MGLVLSVHRMGLLCKRCESGQVCKFGLFICQELEPITKTILFKTYNMIFERIKEMEFTFWFAEDWHVLCNSRNT